MVNRILGVLAWLGVRIAYCAAGAAAVPLVLLVLWEFLALLAGGGGVVGREGLGALPRFARVTLAVGAAMGGLSAMVFGPRVFSRRDRAMGQLARIRAGSEGEFAMEQEPQPTYGPWRDPWVAEHGEPAPRSPRDSRSMRVAVAVVVHVIYAILGFLALPVFMWKLGAHMSDEPARHAPAILVVYGLIRDPLIFKLSLALSAVIGLLGPWVYQRRRTEGLGWVALRERRLRRRRAREAGEPEGP